IDGSLAANAVPLSPTLNGATLTETETSTGNNISSAFTRTDGSGCLPYAHIDVQVSNSGQVCDNKLIYYVEVCNIGTADFEMDAITPYPDASFVLEETQLVGSDPFVGSTLPAGACATYHYTYDLEFATPGITYHFSVDVKEVVLGSTCPDVSTTVVDVVAAGYTWMDRNLGASQAATSSTDALSYGDLYQWGRCADGHEIRTSSTTTTNATTAVPSQGNSWDGKFITEGSSPYDWLATQDDNLWQGVSGTNNPCPAGYRLPTEAELQALDDSFSPNNSAGAYASPVKMPVAGNRNYNDGSLGTVGSFGRYWSSTVSGTVARYLYFRSSSASMSTSYRANGLSVRCLKDGYVATCHDNTTTVVDVAAGGNTWMDRNLGATAVTTADRSTYANDAAYIAAQSASFGDLYQWGRCADGHQIRTSSTTSVNATTASPSLGNSWDGKFITEGSSPYDWLATQDDNLWQGVSGTNNPCPAGYRIPTETELQALDDSFSPNTSAGAYASPVKMPVAGYRPNSNGSLTSVGSFGYYWSSTAAGAGARRLFFRSTFSGMGNDHRANRAGGRSVRCLKD
ncbi:MAG: hypothetical protein GY712_00030, partial [Oceanicoccus sp.]|uniref:FISUMP domain-containing protein n=1 Tax=Oceanicoccus sp. TaxID=2691044 RepID=UPI00263705E8